MRERFLEDFAVGQTFGSGRFRIEEERIKSFAVEFDPQPFHLDSTAAQHTILRGLAASGWHTAAVTMRLLVESELRPSGGVVGAGFDELRWGLNPVFRAIQTWAGNTSNPRRSQTSHGMSRELS